MGRFEELDKQHQMPDADEVDRDVRNLRSRIRGWHDDRYHPGPREADDPVEIQRRATEDEHRSDAETEAEPDRDAETESSGAETGEEDSFDGAGGSSGGSAGSQAAVSTAPEPAPQRDDPDDGEHVSSEPEPAEQEPVESAPSADSADEPAVQQLADDPELTDESVETADEADESEAEDAPWQPWQRSTGRDPQTWVRKAGFRYIGVEAQQRIEQAQAAGESAPRLGVRLNDFPEELVTTLRRRIAPVSGGSFAESVSAISLITAFMIVKLGITAHDCDENTLAAARAVAQTEPQIDALAESVAGQNDRLESMEKALRKTMAQVKDNTEVTRGAELAAFYWLTDRTKGMNTSDHLSVSAVLDANLPKVLGIRDEVRSAAEQQHRKEQDDDGRPIR